VGGRSASAAAPEEAARRRSGRGGSDGPEVTMQQRLNLMAASTTVCDNNNYDLCVSRRFRCDGVPRRRRTMDRHDKFTASDGRARELRDYREQNCGSG